MEAQLDQKLGLCRPVFANDLEKKVEKQEPSLADNTKYIPGGKNTRLLQSIEEGPHETEWLGSLKRLIMFSLDKCKLRHVRENDPKLMYTPTRTELVTDTEEKSFGVTTDLSKYEHCAL